MTVTREQIEDVFGVDNVAEWSNLDNDTTVASKNRIDRAIEWAESWVNDQLRNSIYEIPLVATATNGLRTVEDIIARMAGVWLYESQGVISSDDQSVKMDLHKNQSQDTLTGIVSGRIRLNAKHRHNQPTCMTALGS